MKTVRMELSKQQLAEKLSILLQTEMAAISDIQTLGRSVQFRHAGQLMGCGYNNHGTILKRSLRQLIATGKAGYLT